MKAATAGRPQRQRQQAAEDQAGEPGENAQVQPGDHQQVDRAGELKGLGFFRIDLFAEAQQDGRRQVRLLRTEIFRENLPPAEPQRFQQPRGAERETPVETTEIASG